MVEEDTERTERARPNFTIEGFDPSQTNWKRWSQRFDGACKVFGVPATDKAAYLLHYMGPKAFNILCDKCVPSDPYSVSHEEISRKMEQHYMPTPLEIAENFRFQTRKQQEGETLQEFVAALQKLSINCNFENHLKKTLRNQFVFGILNKRAQARLLETQDLTFDRAIEIATSMELSEKDANQLQGRPEVNYTGTKAPSGTPRTQNTSRGPKKFSGHNKNSYTTSRDPNSNGVKCYRCGGPHLASKCTLDRNVQCGSCGVKGHLQRVCLKKKATTHQVEDILLTEQPQFRSKYQVKLPINNKPVMFEIDSGAAVTLMNKTQFQRQFPELPLQKTDLQLMSYCKNTLPVLGFSTVKVATSTCPKVIELNLYIVEGDRSPLLGREWLRQLDIQLNTNETFEIHTAAEDSHSKIKSLLQKYDTITKPELTKINNVQATLTLKEGYKPVYHKARTVPFKLIPLVEEELCNLEKAGIIVKINSSQWATPIVPILKKSNKIRICGDFKVSLNPQLVVDDHPLPTTDELFATMAGGKIVSKIDLRQAYLQLEVRPEDRDYLTINTHKGLYRCNRLIYGVASAPAIWQREIEKILQGIPGVTVFLDDIKITGSTESEHLERLESVFQRFKEYNVKINVEKCEFFQSEIKYCGYVINKTGIKKDEAKMEAIVNMPKPTNANEVRAFIGFVNYYGRFIPNLSSLLRPLYDLLHKDSVFKWTENCQTAFNQAKAVFQNPSFLVHFDPKLPLILATDASSYGVGAVLSHLYPDGTERPIQYASQTLSTTQRKYAQIDKEAYAIIFGIKKFHQYLYASKFTLVTDHRPLTQIFSPTKGLPVYSAMRMQHYALFLQGFNYEIQYKSTKLHANADGLSRLPAPTESKNDVSDVVDVLQAETLQTLPVTAHQIAQETKRDPALNRIVHALQDGKILQNRHRFNINQDEFTLQGEILLRSNKVVIPGKLQKAVLKELHEGHFGIVKMKNLARSICWWPGIDDQIELLTKSCISCNLKKNNPPKCEPHIWEPAQYPFQRIHVDFAGPFQGNNFMVLVDAYTKWPEVHIVQNINSSTTIKKLQEVFASFGLPQVIVTDNGPTLTGYKFQNFLKSNGICHKLTAPYNPSTNGQAERFVQTLKQGLRSLKNDGNNVHTDLQKLLFQYRIMPHQGTGLSPAIRMFNRNLRSRLDLLRPENIKKAQNPNDNLKVTEFQVGERVAARDYFGKGKWQFGIITKRTGKLHYTIQLDKGQVWKRHLNQLRASLAFQHSELDYYWPVTESTTRDAITANASPTPAAHFEAGATVPEAPSETPPVPRSSPPTLSCRPRRETRPPLRYRDD